MANCSVDDCSSADLNPIGGISKTDLKSFIAFAGPKFKRPILEEFLNATPTAEVIALPAVQPKLG